MPFFIVNIKYMAALKGNKNGRGNKNSGRGRKNAYQEKNLQENVDKFSPIFWEKLNEYIESGDDCKERFAMAEFNKIQCKMIPQENTGDMNLNVIVKDYGCGNTTSNKATGIS